MVKQCVFEKHIPIEVCISSNVMCKTVSSYGDHHIRQLFEDGHSCVICTDDIGVFKSTLSNEYWIASQILNLDMLGVYRLARLCIDHIFGCEEDKKKLHVRFDPFDLSQYSQCM
ncbi:hypothetical protein SeMB42_g05996 [Synchytrium endobioticum]|nr:hypothetical protein SeMB42_g05996 [Synchytrium endobioticum]